MAKKKRFVIFKRETIKARIALLHKKRNKNLKVVAQLHVRLMDGNDKTGINCKTVSLLPYIDCTWCKCAFEGCYDLQNDLWRPSVQDSRAVNSAIHKADPERYWKEISMQIKANFVTELRINVGGDMTNEDFDFVQKLAEENPTCHILFFTKNHFGIAQDIKKNGFRQIYKNLHPVLSAWKGLKIYNPYNLPVAHVRFPNGECTAEDWEPIYLCGGNCSECFHHYSMGNKKESGCWGLMSNEAVLFDAH